MPSERVTYIIGGGNSLEGFDFSKLDGYKIGANRAAIVSGADCLVSMDLNFIRRFSENLQDFKGEIVFSFNQPRKPEGIPDHAICVGSNRDTGLSDDPSYLVGLDSGYAALNLAYQRGAKRIGLLGIDMKYTEGKKHFHSGYSWDKGSGNYKAWIKRWTGALRVLDKKGIEVINYVGPCGSGLDWKYERPLSDLQ